MIVASQATTKKWTEIALKAAVFAAGLGLAASVYRSIRDVEPITDAPQRRKKFRTSSRLHVPALVESMQPIHEALVSMSEYRSADIRALERVARRCGALIETFIKVSSAKGETIRPSIIALGDRYKNSIRKHLRSFYVYSDVVLVPAQSEDGPGTDLVPVNRDLKHAHEELMSAIDCLAQSVELSARGKIEEGVADRL